MIVVVDTGPLLLLLVGLSDIRYISVELDLERR